MKNLEIISPEITPRRCVEYCKGQEQSKLAIIYKGYYTDLVCTCLLDHFSPITAEPVSGDECPTGCNGYSCGCGDCSNPTVRIIDLHMDIEEANYKLELENIVKYSSFETCYELYTTSDTFLPS